jgi:hypothetical protein
MSRPQLSRSLRAVEKTLLQKRTLTTTRPLTYATPYHSSQRLPKRSISQASSPQQPPPPSTPKPAPETKPQPQDRVTKILAPTPSQQTTANISKTGLSDKPLELETTPEEKIDWTRSFHGLSAAPFPKEAADVLMAATDPEEVEIKPDGILYLPEIKYRRILNRAFGPGGWGLVPRSESIVTPKTVTREYALVCHGRYVTLFLFLFKIFFSFPPALSLSFTGLYWGR